MKRSEIITQWPDQKPGENAIMSTFEEKLEAMLRADHERAVAYALSVQYIAESNAARVKQLSARIADLEAALTKEKRTGRPGFGEARGSKAHSARYPYPRVFRRASKSFQRSSGNWFSYSVMQGPAAAQRPARTRTQLIDLPAPSLPDRSQVPQVLAVFSIMHLFSLRRWTRSLQVSCMALVVSLMPEHFNS
jgi:hypothetical protein